MDIKLNFINQSSDDNNSEIVIFQKNVATNLGGPAVAWHVIQNCGRGDNHPFVYPISLEVDASDAYGNYTPLLPAFDGQRFAMTQTQSGHQLSLAGTGTGPQEVQVENRLEQGAITAMVYKDGHLAATSAHLAPGQVASFQFKPTIWIGVVSQVRQGQFMDEAIVSGINTEISLFGVVSADIVMAGGGSGPDAQPFEFHLENVVMA
jgi:hypothetical protein